MVVIGNEVVEVIKEGFGLIVDFVVDFWLLEGEVVVDVG